MAACLTAIVLDTRQRPRVFAVAVAVVPPRSMPSYRRSVDHRLDRFLLSQISTRLAVLLVVVSSLAVAPTCGRSTVGIRSSSSSGSRQRRPEMIDTTTSGDERRRTTMPFDCSQVTDDNLWMRLNLEPVHHRHGKQRFYAPSTNQKAINVTDKKLVRRKKTVFDSESSESEREYERLEMPEEISTEKDSKKITRKKLRLLERQKNKIRSRKQKQKTEENNVLGARWQCKMKTKWKKTEAGIFPPYILTGSCNKTAECLSSVFQCIPRTYLVKVLMRLNSSCYPVPTIGLNSTYEEAWGFVNYKVTVGCNCMKKPSGLYALGASKSDDAR